MNHPVVASDSAKRNRTLSLLRAYYSAFSGNQAIFPFAAQLYFLAEHWFTSGYQGQFIDEAFARAAEDVQTNSTYRSFTASPWYLYDSWFFATTKNLQALGSRHLQEHIKPAYKENLARGIDSRMKSGMICVAASSQAIIELRDEHENFLTSSVPYGIQKLRAMGILDKFPDHVGYIQDNARGMRFSATWETLTEYAGRGQLASSEIQKLTHESDRVQIKP